MQNKIKDVIVIGAGPAGMSAALYASRANLDVMMIERGLPGGQMNNTETLDNYLGTPNVSAQGLAQEMCKQAMSFGATQEYGNILSIEKIEDNFKLTTEKKEYLAKTVIVATGTQYKKLGVPSEDELSGRGVSYCAICDGPFFKDKTVVVVGGGDSALEEADYLTQFSSVVLVHRRQEYRAQPHLQKRVKENPRIIEMLDSELISIHGDTHVEDVLIKTKSIDRPIELRTQGVFIYVGQTPHTELLEPFGVLNESGYVKDYSKEYMTSIPGLFVAGDILEKNIRQVANAVGEGAVAGQSAYNYLSQKKDIEKEKATASVVTQITVD